MCWRIVKVELSDDFTLRKWKLEKKLEVLRSAMLTKKRRSAVARLTRNETIATNIACFFGASLGVTGAMRTKN